MIKPAVDIARLTDLLRKYFGDSPANLAPIESGHTASVFSFDSSSESYVIRIATDEHAESLKKDGLVANLVESTDIPMPAVLYMGAMDDLYFAIATKLPSVQLDELPR